MRYYFGCKITTYFLNEQVKKKKNSGNSVFFTPYRHYLTFINTLFGVYSVIS